MNLNVSDLKDYLNVDAKNKLLSDYFTQLKEEPDQ